MAITGDHGSTYPGRDHPGLTADVEHFRSGAEDDPRHRGVAGELTHGKGVEDKTAVGFVETSGATMQAGEVDMDVQVGALSTHERRLGTFEVAACEIPEGIGASLSRGPLVVGSGRRHEGVDSREQALAFELRQ